MNPETRTEFEEALRLRETERYFTPEQLVALVSEKTHNDAEYINPNSPVGLVLYHAYLGGIEAASHFSKMVLAGVDMTEGW